VADANQDADRDGLPNGEEYLTGTDPRNAQSYLKVSGTGPTGGGIKLSVAAVAGRSYSLEFRDLDPGEAWSKLLPDIEARATNRVAERIDPFGGNRKRFYRLVTPKTP
jgi:hypothetical protein